MSTYEQFLIHHEDDFEKPPDTCGRRLLNEVKELVILATPMSFTFLTTMLIGMQTFFFSGHLGPIELGGAALGWMWCNISGWSLVIGALMALDTFCSQAYGSKNYREVGVVLQRGLFTVTVLLIPVALFWSFTDQILILMKQDETVSSYAGVFTRYMIIAYIPYAWGEALRRYLQAQYVVFPILFSSIIGVGSGILSTYLMIKVFNVGFLGTAYGTIIAHSVNSLTLFIIVIARGTHKETWFGFTTDTFKNLPEFFKLAIGGIVQNCAEWASFEIMAILAGLISTTYLDTQSIALYTVAFCFMIPLGVSIAASTRIGNELGAGHGQNAFFIAKVALVLILPTQIILGGTLLGFKDMWGKVFTDDEDVIQNISEVIPLLAAIIAYADGEQGVASSIIRGCGRQRAGAAINIVAFYVIGLPLGALFAFYLNLGVMGLWYGMGIGMVFQLVSLLFLIFFQDWDKLAEEVRTREIGADGSTDAVQLLSQVRNDDDDEDSDEAHFALGLPSSKNFVDDNDLFN